MDITIESLFKRPESEALCQEIVTGRNLSKQWASYIAYAAAGGAIYGFTMGLTHSWFQAVSSATKVFILFLLTLAITLPTLHFIGLLFGSAIRFSQSLAVFLSGIALTNILLAAFAPISLFFLVSGSSYEFLLLMHVAIFAFCGGAGLYSVKRNMQIIFEKVNPPGEKSPGLLLKAWFLVYMFIGAQMSFLLSPWVQYDGDFVFFVSSKGDFFSYVFGALVEFLSR